VPDVRGMSEDEATQLLTGNEFGLNVDTTTVDSEDQPEGTVVEQSVDAGTSIAQGSVVTLSIAQEPEPEPEPEDSPTSETPRDDASDDPSEPASQSPEEENGEASQRRNWFSDDDEDQGGPWNR